MKEAYESSLRGYPAGDLVQPPGERNVWTTVVMLLARFILCDWHYKYVECAVWGTLILPTACLYSML